VRNSLVDSLRLFYMSVKMTDLSSHNANLIPKPNPNRIPNLLPIGMGH